MSSPRHFEEILPVLLGTLQVQWQRQAKTHMPVLSGVTNRFKYYHTAVENGVTSKVWFPYDHWRLFIIAGIASKLFSDNNNNMETKFSFC